MEYKKNIWGLPWRPQWLRLRAPIAGATGSIPGGGIPHAAWPKKKKKICNTCVKLKKEQNEEPRHLQK